MCPVDKKGCKRQLGLLAKSIPVLPRKENKSSEPVFGG
jgi:hypothetical protein